MKNCLRFNDADAVSITMWSQWSGQKVYRCIKLICLEKQRYFVFHFKLKIPSNSESFIEHETVMIET